MRCNDCNKFVKVAEDFTPEADLSVSVDDGTVEISGTVTVALACEQCGTELKTWAWDVVETVDASPPVPDAEAVLAALDKVTAEGGDRIMVLRAYLAQASAAAFKHCENAEPEIEVEAEGTYDGGAGKKGKYGFNVHYTVTCGHCAENIAEGDFEDTVTLEEMDDA